MERLRKTTTVQNARACRSTESLINWAESKIPRSLRLWKLRRKLHVPIKAAASCGV